MRLSWGRNNPQMSVPNLFFEKNSNPQMSTSSWNHGMLGNEPHQNQVQDIPTPVQSPSPFANYPPSSSSLLTSYQKPIKSPLFIDFSKPFIKSPTRTIVSEKLYPADIFEHPALDMSSCLNPQECFNLNDNIPWKCSKRSGVHIKSNDVWNAPTKLSFT